METFSYTDKIIKVLQHKKQIILQGAPGTGKTYLAKQLAKEITRGETIKNVPVQINDFFKNPKKYYSPGDKSRDEVNHLLTTFQNEFPAEKLKELTVEKYTIGRGTNDSFCWWIERGLKPLGYYFPGSSRSYLIYWSRKRQEYSTHYNHSTALKQAETITDAMWVLSNFLSELVINRNIKLVEPILGASLILKILHSYYPMEYFPMNSVNWMNNTLKLLGIEAKNLNFYEKNLAIQHFFENKKKEYKADVTTYEFMRFLVNSFDLKNEIILQNSEVITQGEYKLIQFHPAYSYEDFVRGISIETDDKGQINYVVKNRILAEFAEKAENSKAKFVLIIDEINRANLPSVLGELIYALEYRYNEQNPDETTVESVYSLDDEKENDEGRKLKLPVNLYIIGTMNTADRSVGHIDYAIRRRFAFVDVHPKQSVIETQKGKAIFKEVAELFVKLYDENNTNPAGSDFLASDFYPLDVMIGHSYFMGDEDKLSIKLNYEVVPILKEYIKDGILLKEAEVKVNEIVAKYGAF